MLHIFIVMNYCCCNSTVVRCTLGANVGKLNVGYQVCFWPRVRETESRSTCVVKYTISATAARCCCWQQLVVTGGQQQQHLASNYKSYFVVFCIGDNIILGANVRLDVDSVVNSLCVR